MGQLVTQKERTDEDKNKENNKAKCTLCKDIFIPYILTNKKLKKKKKKENQVKVKEPQEKEMLSEAAKKQLKL